MAIYETIFILDSLIPPKDIETTIQKYSAIITDNGGTIRKVDKWGKRRLAYEIQKKQYGFYVAIEFDSPGTIPRLLEADYNYNDKVLRFLTYRYDKNQLKAMEIEQNKSQAASVVEEKKVEKEIIEEKAVVNNEVEIEKASLPEEPTEEETNPAEEDEAIVEDAMIDEEGEEEKS